MELPVFEILKVFATTPEPVSLQDLREKTQIPPATLNRLLVKLTESDYVRRQGRGIYTGGPAFMVLSTLAVENLQTVAFRPLLHELVSATGHNAELYAITTKGSVFMFSESGGGVVRTNLPSGFLIQEKFKHATSVFRFARFPEAFDWEAVPMRMRHIDEVDLRNDVERALDRRFNAERGSIRPELARFAVPLAGLDFCVVVSGLLTDFPEDGEEDLRKTMLAIVDRFEHDAV